MFSFFLEDFLEAFPALYFCGEPVTKSSSKNIDLLDFEFFPSTLGTLLLNRNEFCNTFIFKPLTSSKNNSRSARVTGSNTDSFFLFLIVKAGTKSL